jgi:NADH-quinone oxidoreductase subunit L
MYFMFDIPTLLFLIPALPFTATLATALLGPRVLRQRSHLPAVVAIGLSFLASVLLMFQMQGAMERQLLENESNAPTGVHARAGQGREESPLGFERIYVLWNWADVDQAMTWPGQNPPDTFQPPNWGRFRLEIALRADPLTAVMLLIVTCVSTLVAVYSIGYMHDDPGYWRFFTYINLFVFSMTMLVMASNFALLYVFWELVGICSYLLIGFWFEKPEAAAAGKKAFLVNRIGDFGFALGVFFLWTTYGTLDFHDTWLHGRWIGMGILGQTRLHAPELYVGGSIATAIALLLTLGACGKSAQFPLHVWLPDAMEGPTPVSALIHAATMVTAGVYMVARCMPLFSASPNALCILAGIGGITALLGAVIALSQTDLKRILAYSTISHLGYMFVAMGVGTLASVTAGMFHLLTHAFFKSLLFLSAGSVMHAMGGVIDLRRFGGLRRRMPITHAVFLIGSLAMAGVFPLAGFWSKDAILLALSERASHGGMTEVYEILYGSMLLGVLLLGIYAFRPYFLAFYGPETIPPEAGHHAHESPGTMTGPLMVLAFFAMTVGAYFEWTHGFSHFLQETPSLAYLAANETHAISTTLNDGPATETASHLGIAVVSSALALLGVLFAAVVYLGNRKKAEKLARLMNNFGLYSLSKGKFFLDPLYRAAIVLPLLGFARFCAWLDHYAVDGLVDACGAMPRLIGRALRPLQNGLVPFYALAMALGLLMLLGAWFL